MYKVTMKAARVNKKMTIDQAAKKIGISSSTLRSWEKGISFPKQPQIELLCNVYDVPYDSLFFGRAFAKSEQ